MIKILEKRVAGQRSILPLTEPRLKNRRRGLRLNAALVLAVLVAALPIVILSFLQAVAVRDAMNLAIEERLTASVSVAALQQRDPIMMARRILETMAADPHFTTPESDCADRFSDALPGRMPIISFASWNGQGRLTCASASTAPAAMPAHLLWWRRVQAEQGFFLTPPMMGQIVHRPVLLAVLPVGGRKGPKRALTAALDLTWIQNSLAKARLSKQVVIGIADASGRVLTASGPTDFSKIAISAADGRVRSIRSAQDSGSWLYASMPLYGRELFLFFAEPERQVFQPAREQFWMSLILPIGAILLSCFAVWLALDRFVLRWLRRAEHRASRLADGDYRLYPSDFADAPFELRRLGETLDHMAAAIAERDLALRRALLDKSAMAREVNHRVKNNLQMITSLVSLQAARLTDPGAKRLMLKTGLRVGALALVHRLIYELDGSERGLVDTERLFRELCAQLEGSFLGSPNVEVRCQSQAGSISGDQAVAAALIVVEAVTNAFQHGFPNWPSGYIDVSLTTQGKDAWLTIRDNGIGSLDTSEVPGMGHDMMHALSEQLGGQIEITETQGGGRTVWVKFRMSRTVLI